MSDGMWTAMASLVGAIIGALAVLAKPWIEAKLAMRRESSEEPKRRVVGEYLTPQELRILRALSGEDSRRAMYAYRKNAYYQSAIETMKSKKWIDSTKEGFKLTGRGAEIAKEYLKQIVDSWQPD